MSDIYDVIAIGGGAAGMMAAGRAGERGKRVLLLEKNAKLGEKLFLGPSGFFGHRGQENARAGALFQNHPMRAHDNLVRSGYLFGHAQN